MVSSQPVTSTKPHDPIARYAWIAMIIVAVWINVATYQAPVQAQGADPGVIIYQATPTPALPTPAPDTPALSLAIPTPWPVQPNVPVQVAPALPGAPPESSAVAPQESPVDNSAYLANVGAQAEHSPRGDDELPPSNYAGGPILFPATDAAPAYIIDPNPAPADPAPTVPGIAVAVPAISADQVAVLAQRDQAGGCPTGQVFYPRTGCHTPGSGGPQPGAVGEVRP